MNKQLLKSIIIGLVFILPSWAFGATQNIYLDNAGAGAGSEGDPYGAFAEINWTTGEANSIFDWVAGGHDVYINLKDDATWREELEVKTSGASGHPITVQSYGSGADPIIKGSDVMETWVDSGQGLGSTWKKITVTTDPKQMFSDGTRLVRNTDKANLADHEWVWDTDVIYYRDDSGDPDGLGILFEASQRSYCLKVWQKDYVTLKDIEVRQSTWAGANAATTCDYIIFDNITSADNYIAGIRSSGGAGVNTEITITDSTVYNNGGKGIDAFKSNTVLISRNHAYENCKLYYAAEATTFRYSAGIYCNGDDGTNNTNNIVSYNISHDNFGDGVANRGKGIWIDVVSTGCIVKHNKTYDNYGPGIYVEDSDGAVVHHNISWDDCEVSTLGGGIYLRGGAIAGIHDNLVYNNTVYGARVGLCVTSNGGNGDVTGNIFKNNIFVGNNVYQLSATQGGENDGTKGSGNIYLNNCFGVEAADFMLWGAATPDDYDAWETGYGSSTSSVEADPLFTNAGGDDFTLKPATPCRNAAISIPGYNTRLDPTASHPDDVRTRGDSRTIGAFTVNRGAAGM